MWASKPAHQHKSDQTAARLGHGIKVRRLEHGMIVVPGLSPALIIGHHEDHVGAIGNATTQLNNNTKNKRMGGP